MSACEILIVLVQFWVLQLYQVMMNFRFRNLVEFESRIVLIQSRVLLVLLLYQVMMILLFCILARFEIRIPTDHFHVDLL